MCQESFWVLAGEGRSKEGLSVSFQHLHCLLSSHFPQPTYLTTLAVLNLDKTLCAILICTFPLTFAHLPLPGLKCLCSVSYFLPEIWNSCRKNKGSSSICPEIVACGLHFPHLAVFPEHRQRGSLELRRYFHSD